MIDILPDPTEEALLVRAAELSPDRPLTAGDRIFLDAVMPLAKAALKQAMAEERDVDLPHLSRAEQTLDNLVSAIASGAALVVSETTLGLWDIFSTASTGARRETILPLATKEHAAEFIVAAVLSYVFAETGLPSPARLRKGLSRRIFQPLTYAADLLGFDAEGQLLKRGAWKAPAKVSRVLLTHFAVVYGVHDLRHGDQLKTEARRHVAVSADPEGEYLALVENNARRNLTGAGFAWGRALGAELRRRRRAAAFRADNPGAHLPHGLT